MKTNLEIKASCSDLPLLRRRVLAIATEHLGTDYQTDTYFRTNRGRFKLRESRLSGAYLIPYLRSDTNEPKISSYQKIVVDDPQDVKGLFTEILGLHLVVKKRREIFMYENVRIHLDEVDGLGNFVELEAVFEKGPGQLEKQQEKIRWLMQQLKIAPGDLVKSSYETLILEKTGNR